MANWIKLFWPMMQNIGKRFVEEYCFDRAASLAYATLLSIVPIVMVGVLILSLFPIFQGVGEQLQIFLLHNFVAASANVIDQHLQTFVKQLQVISLTTLGALIVVCLLMIYNMVSAFNAIWHVKMQRHLALSFILYLFFILLTPLLFGMVLVFTSYVASLPWLSSMTAKTFLQKPFVVALPYVSSFVVFTFFNWVLPSCKVKLWFAAISGLVTMVLFECAKAGFALYIQYIPTYRLVYGALATIPIFLIWLYVSWLIILLGALLCHELTLMSRRK